MSGPGRREQKKRSTRRAIRRAAMHLFLERGYHNVTTTEVARAAEVSSATLFNHFATKEHLVFGQELQLQRELVELITSRAPGEAILPALREHVLYELTAGRATTNPDAVRTFHLLVDSSAELREHEMAIFHRREQGLAEARRDAAPAGADPAAARVAAAMIVSGEQLIGAELRAMLHDGAEPREAMRRLAPFIDSVFAYIRDGVGGLPHC